MCAGIQEIRMKLVLVAAAAAFALPAFAQDTPPAAPPAPAPQTAPMPATPPADPAATTTTTATAPAPMAAAPGQVVMAAPSPVVQPLPEAAAPADGKVPMCSKTVTDNCMERSNAKGQRLHSTPRAR
jgi:hypothetical protein